MTREGNIQLAVWLPADVHKRLVQYLKDNSVGNNTSERFRQFVYKLLEGKAQVSIDVGAMKCDVLTRAVNHFCNRQCRDNHPKRFNECKERFRR